MIDRLIHFSIYNKFIIGLFTIALICWGAYSFTKLPIDAVPDITNNQVQVITTAPALAAQEVEKLITYPVEISMSSIPDVNAIRSVSRFGISVVTIVFDDEVPMLKARQLVSERLKIAEEKIPADIPRPDMTPMTTGLGEIYQYTIQPKPGYEKKYSAMDLRTIQDWSIKPHLLRTEGIAEVSSFGGFLKQYEVSLNPEKLKAHNITIADVFNALAKNNQNTGGAYIDKQPYAYFIRGLGVVENLDDITKIVIKTNEGVPLLIRDVAEVGYGSAVRYGAMTDNDKGEAVGGLVLMLKGENSNNVIKKVKLKIQEIEKTLPEGIEIKPFLDRSHLVNKAINTVSKNLIEGGLIVIFVLVLLLGNIRAGIVVASVIPLAMLFAIAMMNVFDVSGNLMSLGAIDFGLIVDGAVIIVEAIVHRIASSTVLHRVDELSKEQMNEEVFKASVKIRKSAAFGEIIILIVYLPILSLVGIEGKMFKPMAQTVSFAIIGALVLSLTYVPMMASLLMSRKTTHKKTISDKIIEATHRLYHPVILFALRSKKLIVGASIVMMAIAVVIFNQMGGEFIPTLEEGDFAVETRLAPGSSLSQTIETSQRAASILKAQFPEVKEVIGKIGTSEIPTDPMPIEACDLIVTLKDKDEWVSASDREELADKMNEALSILPGVEFSFQQPIQMRFNELMTGAKQDVAIKIVGDDINVLAAKADEVEKLIKGIKGAEDIYVEPVTGLPQIIIDYKRDKIAQYGLDIQNLNRIVRTAFAGETAGIVFEGEKRFDLVLRMQGEHRRSIEDVKALYVPLPSGAQLPITEVANVQFKAGPMQISRDDAKRRIVIGVNVRNRDVESLVAEIQETLSAKLQLPTGYFIKYGGQFQNLVEAKSRLNIALPVALGLIFILLFFTFNSVMETLLILTAIPFAATGGVLALLARDMNFSISAGVGFIALFGVAVLNGIVLISYFNELKSEGITDVVQRVLKGTEVRLRPVLMTAAVASLGFLPMALSGSEGAEVQKPLATVVIGGLITSTILTLIVLPVLYVYIDKWSGKFKWKLFSIIIPVLFFFLPGKSAAQSDTIAKTLTVEEAVNLAITNSPLIKSGTYEIENQKALKKTSVDLAKTDILLNYGQYNSLYKDNSIGISQSFSSPTYYSSNAQLANQRIKSSEYKVEMSKNELAKYIRLLYFQLALGYEKLKYLQFQDSLFKNFAHFADFKFKTGESAYLEKIAASTRSMEINNQIYQAETNVTIIKVQLSKLLKLSYDFQIEENLFYSSSIPDDSSAIKSNPYLNYLNQQISLYDANVKVEKAKMLPDFQVGYINQSLQGIQNINGSDVFYGSGKRFQYVNAGIGIPIWFKPQQARIESAKIEKMIAVSNYEQQLLQTEIEFSTLTKDYITNQNILRYYHKNALPQAELMIEFANKSYSAGESDYVEFIQNVTEALQIQLNYLDAVNNHNQITIEIDYILGGK